jgi:hypothetical protein
VRDFDIARRSYWSTTDQKWRPLANDASALTGPHATDRRPDFSASDLKRGYTLLLEEQPIGRNRYGVVGQEPVNRSIISTENITPVRSYLITMFPAGAQNGSLHSTNFTQCWGVYLLSRSLQGTSMLAGGMRLRMSIVPLLSSPNRWNPN